MADSKRDEKGLIPANAKDTTQKESNQRAKYTKTLTRLHLFIAPTIAFVVYALISVPTYAKRIWIRIPSARIQEK